MSQLSTDQDQQDQTKTVFVVSTNYCAGDQLYVIDSDDEDLAGNGGGAFDWYIEYADALVGYHHEVATFVGVRARIRLLAMQVPVELEGEDLSYYLNGDIDALEIEAPALAQTDTYLS